MFNVTAESTTLGLWPRANRPVCRLADCHNVANELAQVLLLCDEAHTSNGSVSRRGALVGQGGVKGKRVSLDLSICNNQDKSGIGTPGERSLYTNTSLRFLQGVVCKEPLYREQSCFCLVHLLHLDALHRHCQHILQLPTGLRPDIVHQLTHLGTNAES